MTEVPSHLLPPHTVSCLAYDGVCEHNETMAAMLLAAEEAGVSPEDTCQLTVAAASWKLLTEFVDVAAYSVDARPLADEVLVTARLIELMRLNVIFADVTWGRGQAYRDAYADYWPELSELLGEHF